MKIFLKKMEKLTGNKMSWYFPNLSMIQASCWGTNFTMVLCGKALFIPTPDIYVAVRTLFKWPFWRYLKISKRCFYLCLVDMVVHKKGYIP